MNPQYSWLSVLITTFATSTPITSSPLPARLQPAELAARIDAHIEAGLAARGIEPAPLADEAEFLRRVYLDLAGRIPTEAEARAYLDGKSPERRPEHVAALYPDRQTGPGSLEYADRRARLVEALLANPLYVRHMGNTWQNVMAPSGSSPQYAGLQPGFRIWLDGQVRNNVPYDKMVRDLLTAPTYNVRQRIYFGKGPKKGKELVEEGIEVDVESKISETKTLVKTSSNAGPAAGAFYFQVHEHKAENLAASVSRQFLGVRLECAQCHNHPFAAWTRAQFWELATFFADTQPPQFAYTLRGEQIAVPVDKSRMAAAAKHEMKIPGTDKVVQARFLDGQSPSWSENTESRQVLAEWLTAPSNPYFARTGANRLWAHFFGSGIIDPVDDEPTGDNPASHPALLAELTDQFVANKFDVKHLIRAIVLSKTYQRTSAASHPGQNEPRLFARMAVKGMSPEQLFDSLSLAAGYQDPSANQPGLIIPNTPRGEFLLLFSTQDRKTQTQTSILQALTLMNGSLIANATSWTASPKLTTLLNGPQTNAERIETLYLMTLSRFPRPEEAARMLGYVEGGGTNSGAALADVYWALLNSSEFMFNH